MFSLALANNFDDLVPVVAVGGGCLIALVWIIMATIDSTVKSRAREETRRELAAYVAEGSMTASDAAMIMSAGKNAASACSSAKAADFASPRRV